MKNSNKYKFFLYLLVFICGYGIHAQTYSAGIKGGINSSVNKKAAEIVGTAGEFSTDPKLGFLAGAFFELGFQKFFLRPEVFFSRARGEFPFPDTPLLYTVDKISVPLLIGRKIYKNLDLYAGPAYQHFMNTELENATLTNSSSSPENLQYNLAAQAGLKYGFNNFEIDLRFDFTFNSKDFQQIDLPGVMNDAYFDDGRLNQFMISLNWKIFDSENPWRRKRNCYF